MLQILKIVSASQLETEFGRKLNAAWTAAAEERVAGTYVGRGGDR
jgi:hypothetical protein